MTRREIKKMHDGLRILHLLGPLNPSGMERMLVSGADYFRQHGLTSTVVGQGASHPYGEALRAAGYLVFEIPPIRSLGGLHALRRLLRVSRADIVHVHTESNYAAATLVAATIWRGPRVVRTVHNVFSPSGLTRVTRRVQSLIGDIIARAVIVPSPDVQKNEATYGRKSILIYNWVGDHISGSRQDFAARDVRGDRMTAVIVGNCSTIKNHDLVLRLLFDQGFYLYHHGDERNASAQEITLLEAFERAGRLAYRGTADPSVSLEHASLYLMPSTQEGMPVALAEALTLGVPALINDVPGLRWAGAIRGVRLVDNDPLAWREAIQTFVTEGAQGWHGVASPNFSAERGVSEYVQQYERAAGRGSGVER